MTARDPDSPSDDARADGTTTDATTDDSPTHDAAAGSDEIETRVGLRYTLRQVKRDTTARIGIYTVGFVTFVAVLASIDYYVFDYAVAEAVWYSPVSDPEEVQRLLPPVFMENQFGTGVLEHPMGTDHRGRDIFVRLFYGTRIAITVGFMATGIGLGGGTLIGAVSGYYGGWIDDVLQRVTETVYAIPFLVLVIAFMTAFGRDLTFAMIGVGITSIPVFNRLIRSRVVSVREEDYIEAARAAGVKDRNIILRHVIPNSFAPVLVQATLQIGVSILIVAGLSFLGFGAQPPTPSWGQMLSASRNYMLPAPTFSLFPGIAILVTVVGFNILGDGLQDALDPRINN
ncbi:ABC transporter permease [Halorubrum sp. 48-1-W]|uniref:ABC transporter permease n=1 Tax=Halorubrum sp. 48-1-W TaxID=2249761 RepID=UPI000DCB13F3|nr:ABC transporter permease [Halorubrum sp. 48-1-W]RAW45996.1 ABC transporter permease [Halorubrum sp. 48-1-W]